MPPSPWHRLRARWSSSPIGKPLEPDIGAYERLDGERILELRAASDDRHDVSDGGGWTDFRFRQGHPVAVAHPPNAPYLLVVRVVADELERDDFRRWLGEEHGPRQVTIPGVGWLLAYEEDGPSHSFLNLWGITDPSVIDSDAWMRVRESPWWRRLAHVPANADRGIYRTVQVPHG